MFFLLSLALTSCLAPQETAAPDLVRVGHWLEIRGSLSQADTFIAQRVELSDPESREILIGSAQPHPERDEVFLLLGQPVHFSTRTTWHNLEQDELEGRRVKVEGHWRGLAKFSAREVATRGAGRDRIAGRVDDVWRTSAGTWVRIMRFSVLLPPGVEVEHDEPLEEIRLAPAPVRTTGQVYTDEDDFIGRGLQLTGELRLDLQAAFGATFEDDYNLDAGDAEDRLDNEVSVRPRLIWQPDSSFTGIVTGRYRGRWRDDQDNGTSGNSKFSLGETFGYWRGAFGSGWDLAVGRQDFDEQREWIYDQNLDAVRTIFRRPGLRFEGSVSSTLFDGSDRDENSTNLIGYLSNNHSRRHVAGWLVYRDIDDDTEEELLFGGLRALGSWIPENKVWLELSGLTGDVGDVDVAGWGYDVGTTWKPDFAGPFDFTIGYAFGRGDENAGGSRDDSFRQTGFQDNNGRFGGVSSFRYYGEVVDPELSNLGIFTLGVGVRLAERTSLDVVFHHYKQDFAQPFLLNSDLEANPSGADADIGWELDVIFASRRWEHWDLKVVGGWFRPGDAFVEDDDAFLGRIRLRYSL